MLLSIAGRSSILDFTNCINELQLYLAPQNCKSVLFILRPFNPIAAKIQLHDYQFDRIPSFQYLGVVLDSKLSWKRHISHIRNRAFSACNILKALSPSSWGGDPASLLLFYKSFVRSIIDYDSFLYANAPETTLLLLEWVQNHAIRLALGATKITPILALQAESKIPPLSFKRTKLAH